MPAKGSAEWKGDVPTGTGTFTAGDSISGGYTFKSRFEDGPGSNPEQLIAAAHAACFSMALSNILAQAGHAAESVHTDATVTLRFVDGAPTITKIALVTTGRVPGIDQADLRRARRDGQGGLPGEQGARRRPRNHPGGDAALARERPVPPMFAWAGLIAKSAIVSGPPASDQGRGVTPERMAMEFVKLADGNQLPMLGLGVWQVPDGATCENAVRWALELGYRHIDTAQAYGNEASVGKALRDSGVPRDEVFITTKFYPGSKDPVAEAEKSLRRLGVDQVDLYLVHWPQRGPAVGLAGHGAGTGARPCQVDRRVELQRGRPRPGHRRGQRRPGRQPDPVQRHGVPARSRRGVPPPRHRHPRPTARSAPGGTSPTGG